MEINTYSEVKACAQAQQQSLKSQSYLQSEAPSSLALAATLERLDVHFLAPIGNAEVEPLVSPHTLLLGLTSSSEARIRLALIPLFLRRPQYSDYVFKVTDELENDHHHTLCCFYTAARLLQQKYSEPLVELFGDSSDLPSLFDHVLDIDDALCPDTCLRQLAEKQACLSGKPLNWYGTYEHAYTRLIRHAEFRKQWQI